MILNVYFAAPVAAAAAVEDAPMSAFEFVQALLATRLEKPMASIGATDSIKALVGGKSALQNELLGELEREFGQMPDSAAAAEMPLGELAATADKAGYKGTGKGKWIGLI